MKSALQLNSKAPSAPRCFHSPGLSPTGWWRGRGSNSQAKSHPTFGLPPLRMRNISDQILVRSGPRMRRFSGRYRGGAANIVGGLPPRHSGKLHFAPNYSEPSEANREVSPFLGCQLQQFLRGDGSSRRAKPGFREAHLLPGLRTRGCAIPSGSPRERDGGGVVTAGTGSPFANDPNERFSQVGPHSGKHQGL